VAEAVDDVVPVFMERDMEALAAEQAISAAESQSFIQNFMMLVGITNHKSTLRQGNRNVLVARLEVGKLLVCKWRATVRHSMIFSCPATHFCAS
jgi:hypothetical protein